MTDQPTRRQYTPEINFPEFEALPENPAYAIIQSDVANAINQGFSARSAIAGYRNAGLQFTDSTFFQIYRDTKAEIEAGSSIRALPLDAPIPEIGREVPDWHMRDRFAEVIDLAVYDVQRDEIKQIQFIYYHSDAITVREAIQIVMSTYNEPEIGSAQYYVAISGSLSQSLISPTAL